MIKSNDEFNLFGNIGQMINVPMNIIKKSFI